MFQFAGITKSGVELLAAAAEGKLFTFTRMEYGDGILEGLKNIVSDKKTIQDYNDGLIDTLETEETKKEVKALFLGVNSLVSKKADIGMYGTKTEENITTLKGKLIHSSILHNFNARELGVFAKVDDGAEALFAYFSAVDYLSGNINDTSDFISYNELQGQDHRINIEVATGNTQNISIQYNPGVFVSKEDLDIEVEKNNSEHESFRQAISEIETVVDEKINNIDFSNMIQFDHVVDSDESFLAWANCNNLSMRNVLIKPGTWTLSDKMINCLKTGTKYIFGLPGAKLVFNYQKGIGVGEESNETFVIENVDVEVNNDSADYDCYAIYHGAKARNCNFKAVSVESDAYGFVGSSADDCTSIGIAESSNKHGYGFFDCSYCTRCRPGGASTSATWGGTNIKIDSNTCDNA